MVPRLPGETSAPVAGGSRAPPLGQLGPATVGWRKRMGGH